jgi:hypothetical protein
MEIIHEEKLEVWEPPALTKEQREELIGRLHDQWHRLISPQEVAELWNGGDGIDHPNVVEGKITHRC